PIERLAWSPHLALDARSACILPPSDRAAPCGFYLAIARLKAFPLPLHHQTCENVTPFREGHETAVMVFSLTVSARTECRLTFLSSLNPQRLCQRNATPLQSDH